MHSDVQRISSKQTVLTDKPPCCLEFVPGFPEYFVVGTYNLLPAQDEASNEAIEEKSSGPAQRDGSLVVFHLASDNCITQIETIEVPYGILDIHFTSNQGLGLAAILGVATSTGSFVIFNVTTSTVNAKPTLISLAVLQITDPDTVVTSFTWDPKSDGQKICATSTSGSVTTLSLGPTLQSHQNPTLASARAFDPATDCQDIFTHSLESWISALTPNSWSKHQQYAFSGGDDASLSCTILNSDNEEGAATTIWASRRLHDAGVTAILPLTLGDSSSVNNPQANILLTGSYDDTLRVFHLPRTTTGVSAAPKRALHEMKLGGGVWRIKVLDSTSAATSTGATYVSTLLICAMYAGAFVVALTLTGIEDNDISCESAILGHFDEHESMCYGGDVAPAHSTSPGSKRVVSCSFYDKRLCLWEWTG